MVAATESLGAKSLAKEREHYILMGEKMKAERLRIKEKQEGEMSKEEEEKRLAAGWRECPDQRAKNAGFGWLDRQFSNLTISDCEIKEGIWDALLERNNYTRKDATPLLLKQLSYNEIMVAEQQEIGSPLGNEVRHGEGDNPRKDVFKSLGITREGDLTPEEEAADDAR